MVAEEFRVYPQLQAASLFVERHITWPWAAAQSCMRQCAMYTFRLFPIWTICLNGGLHLGREDKRTEKNRTGPLQSPTREAATAPELRWAIGNVKHKRRRGWLAWHRRPAKAIP